VRRPYVETGHRRALATVFGDVVVDRLAYRQKGQANLHVADAVLNLPTERTATVCGAWRPSSREGSFEEASEAVERATGRVWANARSKPWPQELPRHRRVLCHPALSEAAGDDVLVISADGKGIVMRPDSLRRPRPRPRRGNHQARLSTLQG